MKAKKLRNDAILPTRAHEDDAGLDLSTPDEITLAPISRKLVKLGFSIAVPKGFVGLVCPRSGLAAKQGITVLNGPGVVDAGYRGEVGVILVNISNENVLLPIGSKVAQMVLVPCSFENVSWTLNLDDTDRGENGFGSTS